MILIDALRQPHEEIDVLIGSAGTGALTIEQHDEIDVGGIIQFEGALLAHAEKNPARTSLGIA